MAVGEVGSTSNTTGIKYTSGSVYVPGAMVSTTFSPTIDWAKLTSTGLQWPVADPGDVEVEGRQEAARHLVSVGAQWFQECGTKEQALAFVKAAQDLGVELNEQDHWSLLCAAEMLEDRDA